VEVSSNWKSRTIESYTEVTGHTPVSKGDYLGRKGPQWKMISMMLGLSACQEKPQLVYEGPILHDSC
jgi:hypothetical protein